MGNWLVSGGSVAAVIAFNAPTPMGDVLFDRQHRPGAISPSEIIVPTCAGIGGVLPTKHSRTERESELDPIPCLPLLGTFIADLFKSRRRLEIENLFLRHQLNIVLR
jgi:hypothetical protein